MSAVLSLPEHRIDHNECYALIDIIVLTICAAAGGTDGLEALEEFGKAKLEWLRKYIPLKNGVPSHECIAEYI